MTKNRKNLYNAIIITMFTQGKPLRAVINDGPVSITAINCNKMNFKQRNKIIR